MLHSLLKPLLFQCDPERAHHLTLTALKAAYSLGALKFSKTFQKPCTAFKLPFQNPLGLAAGFDKNGDYIDPLLKMGFGFIEIGTVTPQPQAGNPKPRLFRLDEDVAIINRMGFNNKGVHHLVKQLQKRKEAGIVGVNIGKNKDTPLDKAAEDYTYCLNHVYSVADYVTVNISSPNTPELRRLQTPTYISQLLSQLKNTQQKLADQFHRYVPLCVKISPDLTDTELDPLIGAILQCKMDAVIATNTTVERPTSLQSIHKNEVGGLSGKPLLETSTQSIKRIQQLVEGQLPIIASGGVMNLQDAQQKWEAGAILIQLYSGLIFSGFKLLSDILS